MQVLKVTFSSRIPNVYQSGTFNNGFIRISRDAGATWEGFQMPNGVYSVPFIESAINEAAKTAGWWADDTDPGFKLAYNLATELVYITMDSAKLNAPGGQLGIDFSASSVSDLLGFSAIKTFVIDGTYSADVNARLDWFGNAVSLIIEGLGSISLMNGRSSYEYFSMPLSATSVTNEYVFTRETFVAPKVELQPLENLTFFEIKFRGSSGDVVYILDGSVDVMVQFTWW